VLVNAGQANAATGDLGMQDAKSSQAALAQVLGCSAGDVLIMSTGVIGRRIALKQLEAALPELVDSLSWEEASAARAAVSITTTGVPCATTGLPCATAGLPCATSCARRCRMCAHS
jgi:glutamate N-acetyltransferase / amino-acid N-acetyltransferase